MRPLKGRNNKGNRLGERARKQTTTGMKQSEEGQSATGGESLTDTAGSRGKWSGKAVALAITVNLCRMLLAVTFIFSGFVKANDPYGMVYKLEDYFVAWGIDGVPGLVTLALAVALALVEFSMGIYLFFGISRKPMLRIVALFMGVMTLLTLYIFVFEPVKDCGCFGDAIILTNAETLIKNLVLMAAAVAVCKWHDRQIRFLSPNTEWIISLYSLLYILGISGLSIVSLPVFDFLPYRVGADVRTGLELPDSLRPKYSVTLVYESGGETMELDLDDDDPDSTWRYVETKRTLVKEGGKSDMSDFYITEAWTGDDITEEVLENEDYSFLLVMPDLMTADQGRIDLVNGVYDFAAANGYPFYCLTASDTAAQNYWTDHTGAEYPYYNSDERMLKSLVRSTPGLVLMKDGRIMKKWSCYQIPDESELTAPLETCEAARTELVGIKRCVSYLLLSFIIPAVLLTLADRMATGWAFYRKVRRKTRELDLEHLERKLGIDKTE